MRCAFLERTTPGGPSADARMRSKTRPSLLRRPHPAPRGVLRDVDPPGEGQPGPVALAIEVPAHLALLCAAPAKASLGQRRRDSHKATQVDGARRQGLTGIASTCLFDSEH